MNNFDVRKIVFASTNVPIRICGENNKRAALTLINTGMNSALGLIGGTIFYAYRDAASALESVPISAGNSELFDARAIPHGEIYAFSDTAGLVLTIMEGILGGNDK